MDDKTIYMKKKENPPRIKQEYSTLTITIHPQNPDVIVSEQAKKGASLVFPMPLVEKVEGPFDREENLVDKLIIGETYTYKATQFKDSSFTPIKHIWWAEQLDDGVIADLKHEKNINPYLDTNGYICYDYVVKECKKVRIYAYMAKPIKKVSIESEIITKKVITFFIGGAGDKESYYGVSASKIMKGVKDDFLKKIIEKDNLKNVYEGIYLSYNEARGDEDMENKIISEIPNKEETAIYIIGHSLGGWNGAHLSEILTNKGYNVDLLLTLDPVGAGSTVTYMSDIYWGNPKPKSNYWINISTTPESYEADDLIADLGGQWRPEEGMQINDECKSIIEVLTLC